MVSTVRFTSPEQLVGMGEHAKKQIMRELEKQKSTTQKRKSSASTIKFSEYPPKNPAIILHIELAKEYGHINQEGVFVQELILPGSEKAYRYDFAILDAKVLIEFDGWESHNRKDAFKRDREKQRQALIKGWLQFNISHAMVRNDLFGLMEDIRTIVKQRGKYEIPLISKKGTSYYVYGGK